MTTQWIGQAATFFKARHWATLILGPAALAFLLCWNSNQLAFTRSALSLAAKAALASAVLILIALLQRSPQDIARLKSGALKVASLALVLLGLGQVACSASAAAAIRAATVQAAATCEAIFVPLDPGFAPICTTSEQIALAIEAWASSSATTGTDAGAIGAASPAARSTFLRSWLLSHGGVELTK